MRYQFLLFTAILSFSLIFAGCGSPPAGNNTLNTSATNTNSAVVTNVNSAVPTTKKPEAETTNNAPTLAPVVAAYYEALKKKDEAGLRKAVSAETLKSWETDMKEEKKTSLIAFLTELEPAPEKPFEVRNEKIQGDTGVAELKGGSYAVWTRFKFVRENGEWKITNQSPDVEEMPKDSPAKSNTAK